MLHSVSQWQMRRWPSLLGPCTSELDPVIFGVSPEVFEQSQMLTVIVHHASSDEPSINPSSRSGGALSLLRNMPLYPCREKNRFSSSLWVLLGLAIPNGFGRGGSMSMWLYSKSPVWLQPLLQWLWVWTAAWYYGFWKGFFHFYLSALVHMSFPFAVEDFNVWRKYN